MQYIDLVSLNTEKSAVDSRFHRYTCNRSGCFFLHNVGCLIMLWCYLAHLDHTLDVSMALSVVDRTQRGLAFPVAGVGLEDWPSTLSLRTNHSAHFGLKSKQNLGKLHSLIMVTLELRKNKTSQHINKINNGGSNEIRTAHLILS